VAGRDAEKLDAAYDDPGIFTETVDVTNDRSIEALAGRLDAIDHVVCTASARARGTLAELDREKVRLSFDTKVIGPLMLAKHLGPKINAGGSVVIFSGAAAFKIQVGTLAVAITSGAASSLTRSLAVEMAPIRVNAISPGIIDTGAWDGLGKDGKTKLFEHATETNPARRIGRSEDIAGAVIFCMSNTFLTGVTHRRDCCSPKPLRRRMRVRFTVELDGKQLHLEPGQTVISHGVDRDLTLDELSTGGQPGASQVTTLARE
jgi:NAD(P)-dependent dehydrogenase (short-subunit alcohol dehydrogenase family)